MRRTSASSMPTVCSAADTTLPCGALTTTTPRREHASTSILSTPTPARPMMRSRGARSSRAAVTAVDERVTSASQSASASASASGDGFMSWRTSKSCSRRWARPSGAMASMTTVRTSALDRVAAVHGDGGARHEVGGGAGEEHGDARHVVDRSPALGWGAMQHVLVETGYLALGRVREVGLDPARQHRVDLDVVGRPRGGHRLGQLHDAALRGGVGRRERGAEDRHHRADVDHLATARLLHQRIRGVRAQEGRGQVRVQDAMPLGQRVLVDRLADVGARVVDEDVETAEALPRRGHEARDGRLVGHVDAHGERRGAERLELRHRLTRLVRVARRHHDAGARGGETARHAQPYPAVATGYDGHPSLEVEHARPPVRCKAYTGDALVVVLATTPISRRLSVARLRSASLWHGRCTTRAQSPRIEPDGGYLNDRRRSTLSPRHLRRLARGAPRLGIRPRRQRAPTRAGRAQAPARAPDGFVEPGSPLEGCEELSLLAVRRFVYEAPRGLCARDLLAPAALAARARALVALGRRYIPEVLETLEPLEGVADALEATLLCEAVYECMPYASLSREFLERVPDLAVLPVPDALLDVGDAAVHLAS